MLQRWAHHDPPTHTHTHIDYLVAENTAESNTHAFTDVPTDSDDTSSGETLIVRRARDFLVLVAHPDGLDASAVSASVSGKVVGADEDSHEAYGEELEFTTTQRHVTEVLLTGTLSAEAPVGSYTLVVEVQGAGSSVYKSAATLVVLFNP